MPDHESIEPYKGVINDKTSTEVYYPVLNNPPLNKKPELDNPPNLVPFEDRVGPPTEEELRFYNVLINQTSLDVDTEPVEQPAISSPTKGPSQNRKKPWALDAIDALQLDPKLELMEKLAEPSELFSPESNEAILQIRGKLKAAIQTKEALVAAGPIMQLMDFMTGKYIPGKPKNISTKIAKEVGPDAARRMDPIIKNRIDYYIQSQLKRNLSPEERNYWLNMESLLR